MPRIAILGSCITRDLWPIRGGGAERLLYISRTSLPSLLASPVRGFEPATTLPGDLHDSEHNALTADLQKSALKRLIAFQPTHVIFDFIDERFDLVSAGQALATYSAELVRSGYLNQPALATRREIPRLSAACDRLWLEAASEFAAIVRGTSLGRAKMILHSARWAHDQRLADGATAPLVDVEILTGRPADIGTYNALLVRQETAFQSLMPTVERIDAGDHRLADPSHRWGLSPFHYVPEYYDEVRRQLRTFGLEDAFSDPRVAPSVPAA